MKTWYGKIFGLERKNSNGYLPFKNQELLENAFSQRPPNFCFINNLSLFQWHFGASVSLINSEILVQTPLLKSYTLYVYFRSTDSFVYFLERKDWTRSLNIN